MAEENNTQEIHAPKTKNDVKAIIKARLHGIDLPDPTKKGILNDIEREVDAMSGSIDQVMAFATAMFDASITVAKDIAQQTELGETKRLAQMAAGEQFDREAVQQQARHVALQNAWKHEVSTKFELLDDVEGRLDVRRRKRGEWSEETARTTCLQNEKQFIDHTAELWAEIALREAMQEEKRKLQQNSEGLLLDMGENQGIKANSVRELVDKIRGLPKGERERGPIQQIENLVQTHMQRDRDIARTDKEITQMRGEFTMLGSVAKENGVPMEKVAAVAKEKLEEIGKEDRVPEKLLESAREGLRQQAKEIVAKNEEIAVAEKEKEEKMAAREEQNQTNMEDCNDMRDYFDIPEKVESLQQFFPILKRTVEADPSQLNEMLKETYEKLEKAFEKETQKEKEETTPSLAGKDAPPEGARDKGNPHAADAGKEGKEEKGGFREEAKKWATPLLQTKNDPSPDKPTPSGKGNGWSR